MILSNNSLAMRNTLEEIMIRRLMAVAPAALAGLSFAAIAPAFAEDVKLPPTMAVTAYDTVPPASTLRSASAR
jgi:hypothetical protein